jgi:hypothetical protein
MLLVKLLDHRLAEAPWSPRSDTTSLIGLGLPDSLGKPPAAT